MTCMLPPGRLGDSAGYISDQMTLGLLKSMTHSASITMGTVIFTGNVTHDETLCKSAAMFG